MLKLPPNSSASPTAGIQEALNSNPYVSLAQGVYETHSPIVLPASYCWLIGEGDDDSGTVIKNLHGGHTIIRQATNDTKRTRIQDLKLMGNPASGDGINATANSGLHLLRLTIESHAGNGVMFYHVYKGLIEDSVIIGNVRSGVYLLECNNVGVEKNGIYSNVQAGVGAGVYSTGPQGSENLAIRIRDNDIESTGCSGAPQYAAAILVGGAQSGTIEANYLESNKVGLYIGGNTCGLKIAANFCLNSPSTVDTSTDLDIGVNTWRECNLTFTSFKGSNITLLPQNLLDHAQIIGAHEPA